MGFFIATAVLRELPLKLQLDLVTTIGTYLIHWSGTGQAMKSYLPVCFLFVL
jgi:hypothetical protein